MFFGSSFTAVYDACVLFPNVLRDTLISLAGTELYRARWTQRIHDEWIDAVHRTRPDIPRERLVRVSELMDRSVMNCLVNGWESLEEAISAKLPDRKDGHVAAAAIRCQADVIVTKNLKDFPECVLCEYEIDIQHPDDFIRHLLDLNAPKVCSELKKQRERWMRPTATVTQFLDALARQELPLTVDALRGFTEFL
jgi:hypothetical protein